jgi:hypothetical protein
MDKNGIDIAVFSSLNSVLYSDPHDGGLGILRRSPYPRPAQNLKLKEEVEQYGERFAPLAVLNPKYPGWEHDLGMRQPRLQGIEAIPTVPQLFFDRRGVLEACEKGLRYLVVSIPVRLRDGRGRHWMDSARDIELDELKQLAEKSPESKIVVLEARGIVNSPLVKYPNLYFEISRMNAAFGEIDRLI